MSFPKIVVDLACERTWEPSRARQKDRPERPLKVKQTGEGDALRIAQAVRDGRAIRERSLIALTRGGPTSCFTFASKMVVARCSASDVVAEVCGMNCLVIKDGAVVVDGAVDVRAQTEFSRRAC